MLINLDAKQLEWLCAVYLSKDEVGYGEIRQGLDLHSLNQERFNLPTRVVAKAFLFRLIYGGSAFAYGHDPDFVHVSSSERYWQRVIDAAYDKYAGLFQHWHRSIIQEVSRTGELHVCTGRFYKFFRENGELNDRQIKNYPVQGLGHDLMAIARVALFKRLKKLGLKTKLLCTVHDSVLLDSPLEEVYTVGNLIFEVFEELPTLFFKLFRVEFDLPCRVELKLGHDWGNMSEYTKETLECAFK